MSRGFLASVHWWVSSPKNCHTIRRKCKAVGHKPSKAVCRTHFPQGYGICYGCIWLLVYVISYMILNDLKSYKLDHHVSLWHVVAISRNCQFGQGEDEAPNWGFGDVSDILRSDEVTISESLSPLEFQKISFSTPWEATLVGLGHWD